MSAPGPAAAAARRLLGLVPDRVVSRMLPARLRWDDRAMRVATAPEAATSLFIGPANSAGQGYAWARAVERSLDVAAVCFMTTTPAGDRFGFPADVAVPLNGYAFAAGWQQRQRTALRGFSHALIESGRHAWGPTAGLTPLDELRELQRHGVQPALLWHGSDIRIPSVHARIEPESPFAADGGYPRDRTAVLERNAREHRRLIDESDLPVFVSTPGLLDVPRAQWLPVAVDPAPWDSPPPFEAAQPTVAYAPSNSAMKGDSSIDAQLADLEREGLIRYRRVQGVPRSEMPALYRGADIVLDQFRLGDYGVAACEAMAVGRVVVGHVSDQVRDHVRGRFRVELPIVESTFREVASTVRRLVADRDAAAEIAASGRAFVARAHSGETSARVLERFLTHPGR